MTKLNKDICIRCRNSATREWEDADSNLWKRDGEVLCALSTRYDVESECYDCVIIRSNIDVIPEHCIFKMEHIIMGRK